MLQTWIFVDRQTYFTRLGYSNRDVLSFQNSFRWYFNHLCFLHCFEYFLEIGEKEYFKIEKFVLWRWIVRSSIRQYHYVTFGPIIKFSNSIFWQKLKVNLPEIAERLLVIRLVDFGVLAETFLLWNPFICLKRILDHWSSSVNYKILQMTLLQNQHLTSNKHWKIPFCSLEKNWISISVK